MKAFFLLIMPLLAFFTPRVVDDCREGTYMIPGEPRIQSKADTPIAVAVSMKQVPVICYHNIREPAHGDNPLLTVSEESFWRQIKSLYDSGYHSISPEQLVEYLTKKQPLPPRPILITFDDSHAEHYTVAAAVLEQYHFRGTFFVSTVCLNKRNYLTDTEVLDLSRRGHAIAAHTWDHTDLATTPRVNWRQQLHSPKRTLERITGRPVDFSAYPFGDWNRAVVDSIRRFGYKAAFQLSGKISETMPLYTIRRIMVSGTWSPEALQQMIRKDFK